jgi:hypothetical protein
MMKNKGAWWQAKYRGATFYGDHLPLKAPVFIPTCDQELIEATVWEYKERPATGILKEVKITDFAEREILKGVINNKTLPSISLIYKGAPLTVVGFKASKYGIHAKPVKTELVEFLNMQKEATGHSFFVREYKQEKLIPVEVYNPPPKYYLLKKYVHATPLCIMCNKNLTVWESVGICRKCAYQKAFIYRIKKKYKPGLLIYKTMILEHKTVNMKDLEKYIPTPYGRGAVAVMTHCVNTFMVNDKLFEFF